MPNTNFEEVAHASPTQTLRVEAVERKLLGKMLVNSANRHQNLEMPRARTPQFEKLWPAVEDRKWRFDTKLHCSAPFENREFETN